MDGEASEPRLIISGLGGLYRSLAPVAYALLRFAFGAMLAVHGYAKLFQGFAPIVAERILTPMGFPMPMAFGWWLGILEFVGGCLLAVGFLTRPIALMLAVEMGIAAFGWHWKNGFFYNNQGGGYEFTLLLAAIGVALFFCGSGRVSIDRLLGKQF